MKCVRVLVEGAKSSFNLAAVCDRARAVGVEGVGQRIAAETVRIQLCGQPDRVDEVIDSIAKECARYEGCFLELEPFLKDKDYRGIFRVLE
jgi:hypothetical protein